MSENLKKIESILKWAISKSFKLTDSEWKAFGDRVNTLAEQSEDKNFKQMLVQTISYVSEMSKLFT